MASSAGFQLGAGRIPGERIATTTTTSDSSTFTATETQLDSVTAALVDGRTYQVKWDGAIGGTVDDSVVLIRIREDDTSGTIIQERNYRVDTTLTTGVGTAAEAEFTASTTANKTFVATGLRNGTGTATFHAEGASTRPRLLYVNYISG
jgi:hypothetical protein